MKDRTIPKAIKTITLFLITFLATAFAANLANVRHWVLDYLDNKNKPSCSDNVKNQNEEGVDCGGVCPPCKNDLKNDIIWGSVDIIEIGRNQYSLLAYVNNPNTEVGADSFKYSFSLYGKDKKMFRKIEGYGFIYPSEEKYIIENVSNVDKKIDKVKFEMYDFNLKRFGYIYGSSKPSVSFSDSRLEFKKERGNVNAEFSGIVSNNSNNDFDRVDIVITARDESGKILLAQSVDIGPLMHNDTRFLKIVWHHIYDLSDKVTTTTVESYAHLSEK